MRGLVLINKMRVSKSTFASYIYRYLKPGTVILTVRGKDAFKIEITSLLVRMKEPIDKIQEITPLDTNTADILAIDEANRSVSRFSCGCERGEMTLCTRHGGE